MSQGESTQPDSFPASSLGGVLAYQDMELLTRGVLREARVGLPSKDHNPFATTEGLGTLATSRDVQETPGL